MKIVIQCAGSKNETPEGGGFRSSDNRLIKFVAHPECASFDDGYAYVRPDDPFDGAQTWRKRLLDYNRKYKDSGDNPLRLFPAYQLYEHPIYRELVEKFGIEQVFILSAGWGLIRSDFLTPYYNITFRREKDCAKRGKSDYFCDFQCLPDDRAKIVFLGGKDYLPLFQRLTKYLAGQKTVFYHAKSDLPLEGGFVPKRFKPEADWKPETNWQYNCAKKLINDEYCDL